MSLIDALRYRFRVLLSPRTHERDVAEEVDFHVDLEAMQRTHAAAGTLSPNDARNAARRRFGNATYYREETRRVAGLGWLDVLRQDVSFALRTLARAPTFTIVAVLTLAIGIGANTAIFSAVDALILRPLPFRDPGRLMSISLTAPGADGRERNDIVWSYAKFAALRDGQTVFSSVTLWTPSMFTFRSTDEAMRVNGEYIDSRYLTTLGIAPMLGRNFHLDEDELDSGASLVALIGADLWEYAFSSDSSVLGRRADVDGIPYTIVGVMPRGFHGLSGDVSLWMPIASSSVGWNVKDPYNHTYFAIGRLSPGATAEQASAVVRSLGGRIDAQFPDRINASRHWGAVARKLDDVRVDDNVRRTMFILFGAVGVVLLIACANVASLFLVRATSRRREIAVRLAIGAGRGRLIRQLLVESLMLSSIGGVASVAVAWVGVHLLAVLRPAQAWGGASRVGIGAVSFGDMRIDGTALAFTAAIALGSGIVFGLMPAFQATRPSLTETLKDDGAARASRLRSLTSRHFLTVVEIALAVVLLAGSGLLIRSLALLLGVRPGFDAGHVLSLRINRAPAWSKDSIATFYDRALSELAALPGVSDVALGDLPPANGGFAGTVVALRDRPPVALGQEPRVGLHYITPTWPSVFHVPLVRGRLFTRGDVPSTRKVVLVNETAARTFWPNQDPIGRPISVAEGTFRAETAYVVGVLGDVKFASMDSPPVPDVYVSYYQLPFTWRMMFFVRTHGDARALEKPVRETLRRAAPGFPIYDVRTMDDRVRLVMAPARFSALLLTIFAAVALVLAMIGTYGVISYSVTQRTREIGVRVALGATSGDVTRLIVTQGIGLAIVGAVIGLAGAVATTRMLKSMLYRVEPGDPLTLAGIVAVLLLAVLAASWIPARRASLVPAIQALRGD